MFESVNEIVLTAIVMLCGGIVTVLVGRWLRLPAIASALLYLWHSVLGFYFANYVLNNGGDAFAYYQKARFGFVEADLGTDFIVWLTSFPASIGLTYWPLSFLYNVLGSVGLVFFYAALKEAASPQSSRFLRIVVYICVAIPSLSFWTSGIGKDAIAFLSVGLFLWSTSDFGRRHVGAIAAVFLMLGVRPHMAGIMVLSIGLGVVFVSRLRPDVRLSMGTIATGAGLFAIPLVLTYAGTDRFTSFGQYIADRQEANMSGGSSIDIVGMNPVFRLLSYLYRPLPNEAAGFAQLAASLDNLILILLTVVGLVAIYRAGFMQTARRQGMAMLYGLASVILLSQLTANLGLATRQKWMAVPALMLIVVEALKLVRDQAASRRVGIPSLARAVEPSR